MSGETENYPTGLSETLTAKLEKYERLRQIENNRTDTLKEVVDWTVAKVIEAIQSDCYAAEYLDHLEVRTKYPRDIRHISKLQLNEEYFKLQDKLGIVIRCLHTDNGYGWIVLIVRP